MAEALDVTDPVRSPSFTLANIYAGRMTVQHLDLYRLDEIGDDDALALEEYVCGDAVTLVEWPQAGIGRLGPADVGGAPGPRIAARTHARDRGADRGRAQALGGGAAMHELTG